MDRTVLAYNYVLIRQIEKLHCGLCCRINGNMIQSTSSALNCHVLASFGDWFELFVRWWWKFKLLVSGTNCRMEYSFDPWIQVYSLPGDYFREKRALPGQLRSRQCTRKFIPAPSNQFRQIQRQTEDGSRSFCHQFTKRQPQATCMYRNSPNQQGQANGQSPQELWSKEPFPHCVFQLCHEDLHADCETLSRMTFVWFC
jgi:hypothetical protein